jgi:hypothetical protein
MYCPKCNKENPDNARFCNSCGCVLSQAPATTERVNVRVSKLASFSLTCALCGLALNLPSLIALTLPRVFSPRSEWVGLTFLISICLLLISLISGIASIVTIETSGGKITGRAYAVAAVLLPIFIGILHVWLIISRLPRSTAFRMVCGTNLSGLGKAMLIYSNDYNDKLPRAGGPNGRWVARLPWWAADNLRDAYGLSDPNATEGRASVSASLYLLVKYTEATPKSFVCNKDFGTTEFMPTKYGIDDNKLIDLWDFGPEPTKHYSYSYHMPYGPYALTISSEPGMAVAADRNPWQDSPFKKASDFNAFNPDGDREAIKAGNCISHQGDGQNVLFMDAHVSFEKRSYCGINEDNIYTYWDGPDIRRGAFPVLGSQPADRLDSMLVNDPAIPR